MTCTVSGLGMSIKSTFQGGQGKKSKALPGPLGTLETKMVTCDGKHSILMILQKYLEVRTQ